MRALRSIAAGMGLAGLAIAPLAAQTYVWRPGHGGFSTALSPVGLYDPASVKYFAAMGVDHQPDDTHKALIDTAIRCTKAGGGWAKLDWLLIPQADLTASLVDAAHPTKSATAPNGMGLTAYKTFEPDGVSQYLNFGEAFGAAGNHFAANDATIGSWLNGGTPVSGAGYAISNITGAARNYLRRDAATTIIFSVQGVAGQGGTGITSGPHDATAVRADGSVEALYLDGIPNASKGQPFATFDGNAGAFGFKVDDSTNAAFSSIHASLLYSGAAFTAGEITKFDGCWRTYLQSVGAIS